MSSQIQKPPSWLAKFPGLAGLPSGDVMSLASACRVVALPPGTRVFAPGEVPEAYLLLISGSVRVQQVSEQGREIVLYRVAGGESCVLTTSCLLGHDAYQAEAVTETDVEAVAMPAAVFDELIARSAAFRRFVFEAISTRVANLFRVIEEVAFSRIDVRLAQRLLDLAGTQRRVELTHQQLAAELGSAREVISRQLTEFQRRGWIVTARGSIEIVSPDGLRKLAASP